MYPSSSLFFFFNDTATTEIYTLSLHDALPILLNPPNGCAPTIAPVHFRFTYILPTKNSSRDRKSTRLNSSHLVISYAVFCLKKKKTTPAMSSFVPHTSFVQRIDTQVRLLRHPH